MRSEIQEFGEMNPPVEFLALDPGEIGRLAGCGPDDRWSETVRSAVEDALGLLHPRARWRKLSNEGMNGLFPAPTPVEGIARKGQRWAVVATIGPALEARVKELFRDSRYLEGVLVDAVGSVAVDSVCDLVERELCRGESADRYSPGYCGWRLEGQRRFFDLLRPEELGVRLLPSLLMSPLKSITCLVVRAPSESLLVPVETCEQCGVRGCTRRRGRRHSAKTDTPKAGTARGSDRTAGSPKFIRRTR